MKSSARTYGWGCVGPTCASRSAWTERSPQALKAAIWPFTVAWNHPKHGGLQRRQSRRVAPARPNARAGGVEPGGGRGGHAAAGPGGGAGKLAAAGERFERLPGAHAGRGGGSGGDYRAEIGRGSGRE